MELLEYIRFLQFHEQKDPIFVETDDAKYDVYESIGLKINGTEVSSKEFYDFFRDQSQYVLTCNGYLFTYNGEKYINDTLIVNYN